MSSRDTSYTEYLKDAEERRLDREGYDPPLGDSRAGWERDERRLDREGYQVPDRQVDESKPATCPVCGKVLQIQGFGPQWWLACSWNGCGYSTRHHTNLVSAEAEANGGAH